MRMLDNNSVRGCKSYNIKMSLFTVTCVNLSKFTYAKGLPYF